MADRDPENRLSASNIRDIIAVIVFGIGLGIYCIQNNRPDVPLVPTAFILSYIVAVLLHELGHAVGTVSAGGHVHFIQLGQAYKKWEPWNFRFLGFLWKIYSAPLSGSVHSSFYTTHHYRLRRCWMIACGPLVNFLLIFPALIWMTINTAPENTPYLMSWCIANALILLISVPARVIRVSNQMHPNDGFLFWQTLRYSDTEIKHIVQYEQQTRQLGQDSALAQTLTLSELLATHEAEPTNYIFLWHLLNRLQEANDPQCVEYLLKLIALPEMTAPHISAIIDSYLTWQLNLGPPSRPEVVDQLSLQLLASENTVSTRGTRGSVLVDLNRIEEGKKILQDVLAETSSTIDKVYANAFLALVAKSEGNFELALEHAQKARQFDASSPVLKRISDLLKPKAA